MAKRSGDTAFGMHVTDPKAAWRFASRRSPRRLKKIHAKMREKIARNATTIIKKANTKR